MAYNRDYQSLVDSGDTGAPLFRLYNAVLAKDELADVLTSGYFPNNNDFEIGDVLYIYAEDGAAFIRVTGTNPVTTAAITGATPGTDTLQAVYANTNPADIELDSTNGQLTIKDNATPLSTNLFRISNNAKSTDYFSASSAQTYVNSRLLVGYGSPIAGESLGVMGDVNINGPLNATGQIAAAGGFLSYANIDIQGQKVVNGGAPTSDTDLVTKAYVDSQAGNSETLQEAYNNGSNGVITVDSTNSEVEIRDASPTLNNSIFSVSSNDGATKYFDIQNNLGYARVPMNFTELVNAEAGIYLTNVICNLRTITAAGATNLSGEDPLYIIAKPNSGTQTLNLPGGNTGKLFIISNASGSGAVNIDYQGSTITTINNFSSALVIFDGTQWDILVSSPEDITLQNAYNNSNARIELATSPGTFVVKDSSSTISDLFKIVDNEESSVYFSVTTSNTNVGGNLNVFGDSTFSQLLTASGGIDANNNKIENVATPTVNTDAANKAYVDALTAPRFTSAFYFTPRYIGLPGGDHILKLNDLNTWTDFDNDGVTPSVPASTSDDLVIYYSTSVIGNINQLKMDIGDWPDNSKFTIYFDFTRASGGGSQEYIYANGKTFRSLNEKNTTSANELQINSLKGKTYKFWVNGSVVYYMRVQ